MEASVQYMQEPLTFSFLHRNSCCGKKLKTSLSGMFTIYITFSSDLTWQMLVDQGLFKTRHCTELCTTGMNQQPVKHRTKYKIKIMLIYASRVAF